MGTVLVGVFYTPVMCTAADEKLAIQIESQTGGEDWHL
jgi:hypothetical protein